MRQNAPRRFGGRSTSETRDTDRELRINRFLAEAGVGSRRKAEELVLEGVVKVNGTVITDLATKVIPSRDEVRVRNVVVNVSPRLVYILLNKPKDCITTTDDERGRTTVMDLVQYPERLFPIGRLDRNTTGALVLTNDGDLAHALMHPSFLIRKVYGAVLDRGIDPRHLGMLRAGIDLEDGRTAPCEAHAADPPRNTHIALAIHEGRNRQVHRMFESLGYVVKKLDRYEYAGLTVDGLRRGGWRFLEEHEVKALKKLVKKSTSPRS